MSVSPFTRLFLLLAIFYTSVAALSVNNPNAKPLAPRQSPAANTATDATCQNYARVANLSTVALNSTLRAAFLRSINLGTDAASSLLDTQSPKLLALKFDEELNTRCGNLSAIALEAAGTNLTAGTVLGIKIIDAVGIAVDAPHLPIIMVLFIIMFGGTWISL
ncbi:hypothetical protein B0O99DRAFT_598979 [Bisporella sp. PMI_857]|nr:hypothetical protein B0O99DRAFT_598979 [Bisporella sp. PMI_857]